MPYIESAGVRAEVPEGFVPTSASDGGGREPTVTGRRLGEALFGAGVVPIFEVRVTPAEPSRGLARPRAHPELTLEVGEGVGSRPVVLVEQDGVLRWAAPLADGRRFVISLAATRTEGALAAVADYLDPAVTVRVFPSPNFDGGADLAPRDDLLRWCWEREPSEAGSDGRRRRLLLLVHDAFSDRVGPFGGSASHPPPGSHASPTRGRDAVLLFEHDTVDRTPEENARNLADLVAASIPSGTEIDVLAVGRGGIVARCWLEDPDLFASARARDVVVREVVFVGCPNGGTPLAEAGAFDDLLDLRTTLLAHAGGLLGATDAPDPAAADGLAILGRVIRRRFATTSGRFEPRGWTALEDGGEAMLRLAGREPSEDFLPVYRSVFVAFEPSAAEEPRAWATALAAAAEPRFGGEANDLVVSARSATAFGRHAGRHVDRIVTASARPAVDAGFGDDAVRDALAGWWEPKETKASGRPSSSGSGDRAPLPGRRASPPRSETAAAISGSNPSNALRSETPGPRLVRSLEAVAAPSAAPERERAMILEASMPSAPPVGRPVALEVSLEGVVAAAGRDGAVPVVDDDVLMLTVVALENGRVICPDAIEGVRPPAANRRHTWTFLVVCNGPGPARFAAEVRRGVHRLAVERLEVTAGGEDRGVAATAVARFGGHASPLEDRLTLRVVDRRTANGDTELAYTLGGPGLDVEDRVRLDGRTWETFLATSLARLESIFADTGSTASREDRVRALGLELADTLLPTRVRDAIWAKRKAFSSILIVADEHLVPWEVVHIDDPTSREPGFTLAEKGLTRWFRQLGLPSDRQTHRLTPAAYVKPTYLHPDNELPELDREIEAIDRLIGPMRRRRARSRDLLAHLGSEPDVAVLHVCGHGDVVEGGVGEGLLLLQDGFDDHAEPVRVDELDSRVVAATLRLRPGKTTLVFLNTCRSGRATRGLVGASGYARAFVAPRSKCGASVFVGTAWGVGDAAAAAFSEAFYRALVEGRPLHRAATAGREAARLRSTDFTWLAYCVYGDPDARFSLAEPSGGL